MPRSLPGSAVVAAVDLGAASGRVLRVEVSGHSLVATEVHRFANNPVRLAGRLYWNALSLYQGVVDGLRRTSGVDSIAIDSWAIDYGLLDASGALLGNPLHYRDTGTDGVLASVVAKHGADDIFTLSGIALLPFNTLYQLAGSREAPQRALARTLLMIPDLLAFWLTGTCTTELTNASTTQLLDITTRAWSPALLGIAGLEATAMPALLCPGTVIAGLRPDVGDATGLQAATPVVAVGSHDTASAVVAAPMQGKNAAFVSCGTWSLVGVELAQPVLTPAARLAGFSNELGVDGTVRFLHNVMGLWLLQETLRQWQLEGVRVSLSRVLDDAARGEGARSLVNPDDTVFLPPGDMPGRIRAWCERTHQLVPETPAQVVRCILDSLALAHARALRSAAELSGRVIEVVHVVGGGAQNALLCQLTADASGLPVVAGPVEASGLGNALVQARTLGAVSGGLAELRSLVCATQQLRSYQPRGPHERWIEAEARIARGRP